MLATEGTAGCNACVHALLLEQQPVDKPTPGAPPSPNIWPTGMHGGGVSAKSIQRLDNTKLYYFYKFTKIEIAIFSVGFGNTLWNKILFVVCGERTWNWGYRLGGECKHELGARNNMASAWNWSIGVAGLIYSFHTEQTPNWIGCGHHISMSGAFLLIHSTVITVMVLVIGSVRVIPPIHTHSIPHRSTQFPLCVPNKCIMAMHSGT